MIPLKKMDFPSLSRTLFLFVLLFGSQEILAQNPHEFFWEPDFKINVSTESRWAYSFGIANRGLLAERFDGEKISGYENQHIELNQFTKYNIGENSALSLGFRYRFRETFDDSRHDEFRIIQQFNYSHSNSAIGLSHRARFEQRFRNETIFRLRYQIGISRPLNEVFSIGLSTEALYSMSRNSKPGAEQRFNIGIDNTSFKNVELSFGFSYQMAEYNISLVNEYFFLTGVALDL